MLTRIRPLAIVALLFAAGCSEAPEERDQAQVVDPPAAPSFNDTCAVEDPGLAAGAGPLFPGRIRDDGHDLSGGQHGHQQVLQRGLPGNVRWWGLREPGPHEGAHSCLSNGDFLADSGVREPAENFERAISVLKGGQYLSSSQRETLEVVPRTIEVLPAQEAVFVRLDPRPASGRTLEVMLDRRELFPEIEVREGESVASGNVFVVGR